MSYIKTFFLLLLISTGVYAEIRQTHDLNIIKKEIFASPKHTLVIFDVDYVLTTPSDEIFIMSNTPEGLEIIKNFDDHLWAKLPREEVNDIQSAWALTAQWRAVTPDTAKIFNEIKSRGYKILGLTASGTGGFGRIPSQEKWRVDELQSIGITFDPYFVNAKPGLLDQFIPNISQQYAKAKQACFPAASNGIIFTCKVSKGDTLDAYLQFANIHPKKIIFIDDRTNNLETVSAYCKKNNIEFIGYEYTAIKEQAKKLTLNPQRAKLQFKVLELTRIWLDDKQADMLLATLNM